MRDCKNCTGGGNTEKEALVTSEELLDAYKAACEKQVLLTSKELIEALMYVIANRDDEEAQENLREAQIAHFKASAEAFCAGENGHVEEFLHN